jgi:hypothetical protein
MEFHLSASLTAVQSAFYVLRDHNRSNFESERHRWLQTRSEDERSFLNRMMSLRDTDVHSGMLDAASVDTHVDAARVPGVTVFGPPGVFVEGQNPDGSTVRAAALMTVQALYVEHAGKRIEATVATRHFIALLRDLVEHFNRRRTAASDVGPEKAST